MVVDLRRMKAAQIAVFLALGVILGIPFLLRPAVEHGAAVGTADTLIVVTPHVQQIRAEFGAGFDRWHLRKTGRHARVDWRTPGGTTEIVKQLEAEYTVALKSGIIKADGSCGAGAAGTDVALGGGSYDHGRIKAGVKVEVVVDGQSKVVAMPMSVPAGFSRAQLDEWFGENTIGAQTLYDPEQYWLGTALSGFGIVYNRDVLAKLGLPEPRAFGDLTDPRYSGWVALADPRQSGSVTTTFDSILSNAGWDEGWRVLRAMCANTRYFTNSSTKPPIDVSQGEAAAGLAIDFYGRSQAQSVQAPGQDPKDSRVGYVDPQGAVYIDADPVSILRGGPNPELAREFVEFCLSEEGQALWQLRSRADPKGADNPVLSDGERMGPLQHELRRMPVRRVMYEKYLPYFIDQVDPFTLASKTMPKGWRSGIGIMMGAFAIDTAREQRAAWTALNRAKADPVLGKDTAAEMERLFYAWPTTSGADGAELAFTPENFKVISGLWKDAERRDRLVIRYTAFFKSNYERIVRMGRGHGEAP
jgi:iron(III) transport system substrate-binding protein